METQGLIPSAADPMALFESWFNDAKESEPNDPDAMSLATATPDGVPSVRMILLKGLGPDGFCFYTNKESRKGEQCARGFVFSLEVASSPGPGRGDAFRSYAGAGRCLLREPVAREQSRCLGVRSVAGNGRPAGISRPRGGGGCTF
jgi:hypothetical protein